MGEFVIMLRNVLIFVALAIPGYVLVKGKLLKQSPSTPLYNCSKHILAVKHNGISCANICPKYPDKMYTPFVCVGPESSTSLSIFTNPPFPVYVLTVILVGFPKE